ncbi:MAG: hypothetical protein ACLTZ3_09890 [Hominilimicola sp.]
MKIGILEVHDICIEISRMIRYYYMSGEMYKEHIVEYCNMVDTFNRTVWC